jgi:large subunit ribosomal protein L18
VNKFAEKQEKQQVNNMLAQRREEKLKSRHLRIRKKLFGTPKRPRLAVHRSHLNFYAQVIDDQTERTLLSSSTLNLKEKGKKQIGNIEGAKRFGEVLSEALKKKKITQIVFDRGGFAYHGRVKAFADVLREHGIKF